MEQSKCPVCKGNNGHVGLVDKDVWTCESCPFMCKLADLPRITAALEAATSNDEEEAVLGDHNLIPSYKAEIDQLKAAIKPVAKWWRTVDSDGLDEVVVELTTDELNALDALSECI